jgi:glycerophosphoryl diester phosphodiesterase
MSHPFFRVPQSRPQILGHRGAAGTAPENTLEGFAEGLRRGADILESDVHLSRDGVPVLLHDPEVDRTSDGNGAVGDLKLEEIQKLDAGYRFALEGTETFVCRGQGLRIPTLEEAFRRFPDARFNLELKAGGELCARRVIELVKALDRENRTLLTAGDGSLMDQIVACAREQNVHPAFGASARDAGAFARSAAQRLAPPPTPMVLQIPVGFGDHVLVTDALIAHAHAHQVHVHVWTINEEKEMMRLLDMGVDGLVTDFPGRMKELLQRRHDARL